MQFEINPQPPGACNQCGRAARSPQLIGTRCVNPLPKGPCTGSYRATLAASDWMLCSACNGNGTIDTQRCGRCEDSGWIYARPQFP